MWITKTTDEENKRIIELQNTAEPVTISIITKIKGNVAISKINLLHKRGFLSQITLDMKEIIERTENYLKDKNVSVHIVKTEDFSKECTESGYFPFKVKKNRDKWSKFIDFEYLTNKDLIKGLWESADEKLLTCYIQISNHLKKIQKEDITFQYRFHEKFYIEYEGGEFEISLHQENQQYHLKFNEKIYPANVKGIHTIKKLMENERRLENIYEPPRENFDKYLNRCIPHKFSKHREKIHQLLLKKMNYKEIETKSITSLGQSKYDGIEIIEGIEVCNILGYPFTLDKENIKMSG
jgi:hypothetical protein